MSRSWAIFKYSISASSLVQKGRWREEGIEGDPREWRRAGEGGVEGEKYSTREMGDQTLFAVLLCLAFVRLWDLSRQLKSSLWVWRYKRNIATKPPSSQHRLYRSRPYTPGWRKKTSNCFLPLFLLPGWQMFCDFLDKNISFNSRGEKTRTFFHKTWIIWVFGTLVIKASSKF